MKGREFATFPIAALLSLGIAIAIIAVPSVAIAADMDGVMMSGGKMMMMKMGKPAGPMDHEMTMSDGTRVLLDGTVKFKYGPDTHLHDGQMIMMDGHIMNGGKAQGMSQ
ncbi:MAG TPA: DUF6799 domain-containing protein [Candidatus Binataceae bacterium]